ncbi:hypothetical protein [Micromonospora sp. L32]|uniref:hypothetical protein n=1 Tax=Micromonospora sp. L32 TaxID=3452214 RepID=UPI003F8C7DDD
MERLRETGNEGLGKGMAAGLRLAAAPLKPAVLAEVPRTMPSGYAPVLSRSLQFRTTVRAFKHVARATWRVYGDGRRERRDVPALNRGVLKHPTFGRRNQWVAQSVRRGFVDRPADRLAPAVRREMNVVIDKVAEKILKG